MSLIQQIKITDADIDKIAGEMELQFDDERRRALKEAGNCYIQACPGSGKTVLLTAKLAILASKWPFSDKGICVLSHTNVARNEVEKNLSKISNVYRLLEYPHFIGTIQSFVDKFLALPFLRFNGIDISIVDTDYSEKKLETLLQNHDSFKHNRWIQERARSLKTLQVISNGTGFEIRKADGQLGLKDKTNRTYKSLEAAKNQIISREGICRFDEMYAFAMVYITRFPWIKKCLRKRFPLIFIDEMQDTNEKQKQLLIENLFNNEDSDCTLQQFGDANQAIFHDDEKNTAVSPPNPREIINLSRSFRFNEKIASFASSFISENIYQEIQGNALVKNCSHTIFLFDEASIHKVLTAFGEQIFKEYPQGISEKFRAKAIGFRRQSSQTNKRNWPITIGDYWKNFSIHNVLASHTPQNLFEYILKGRLLLEKSKECKRCYDEILQGILQLFHRQKIYDFDGKRFNQARLLRKVDELGFASAFQKLVKNLCLDVDLQNKEFWEQAKERLKEFLKHMSCADTLALTNEASDFLEFPNSGVDNASIVCLEKSYNTYYYQINDKSLPVQLTTIHSVKGETHNATLLLETFYYAHELLQVLPLLKGEVCKQAASDNRFSNLVRRVFVAMTRPRELLCLAMPKKHLDKKSLTDLEKRGWVIKDLTLS